MGKSGTHRRILNMNIADYKKYKELDAKNKTSNVTVSKINLAPALTIKKYNPDTGE
jgi:hypothetical protein